VGVYILRRFVIMVPLLVVLSLLVYLLVYFAPGDPTTYFLPETASDDQRAAITARLGLDQPVHVQYWRWLSGLAVGDFGVAYSYGRPALEVIGDRLGPTVRLQSLAITLSIAIAIPAGILSAVRRYSLLDHVTTTGTLFGLSMPDFWFALMLTLFFSVHLGWLPSFGTGDGTLLGSWQYLVMPVLTLGLATVPWYARFMRSSMLDVLSQDYVRTARAKGLTSFRVHYRHALKVAVLPVVTIIGLSLPRLVGGAVIVETIFAWPGLGRLAFDAVTRQDYPLIMALTVLTGAFVLVLNLLVDVIYTWLDPRITYDRSAGVH